MIDPALADEGILFSLDIPDAVNDLLQAAVIATRSNKLKAEWLLHQAYQQDRHCLQTYYVLYKFYFHHKNFMEAEYFALAGLAEAASQDGFPADYQRLYGEKKKWDMYANDVRLYYLYSLKALAFIKLRREELIQGQIILAILKELDPEDRSGASVIMAISDALGEDIPNE